MTGVGDRRKFAEAFDKPCRLCRLGCPSYNAKLDWCRVQLIKHPTGCAAMKVRVGTTFGSPEVDSLAKSNRKPAGD